MAYVTLRELLPQASKSGYGVGAFNIFNYQTALAVIQASEQLRSPVILQTSVKTVKQFGAQQLADLLFPMLKKASVPVALHLDHCTDVDFAKQCIDVGWSSIMIDGSHFPLEKNIEMTAAIVNYAKGKNVSVEGELGRIVGVEDDIVVAEDGGLLADTKSSKIYLEQTGIDAFAPAIGTAHGVYKGVPKIDFQLFEDLAQMLDVSLVVHGGTGLEDDVFKKLISLGGAKINVSTAIKLVYLKAAGQAGGFSDPLNFDEYVIDCVKEKVSEFIGTFNSAGKA